MTKLCLLFIVCSSIGYLSNVVIGEPVPDEVASHDHERDHDHDHDEDERSGAQAQASVKVRPVSGGYNPNPPIPGRILVECYICSDCKNVYPNTTTKWCPLSFDQSKSKSCVVYSEKYKHMSKPLYIRGCASERGSCADIKRSHETHSDVVKLLHCRQCEGDRCNGSTAIRSLSEVTIAFIALIFTPIAAKYTLS